MNTKRKIKFRVWNETYHEMFYPKGLTKNGEYEEKMYLQLDGVLMGDFKHTGIVDCSENYVVQQYTGIKDKGGKEIYEGDRIEFYSKDRKTYYFGEVRFTDGSFLVKIVGHEGTLQQIWMHQLCDYVRIRVVGNIFQLPCKPDHNGECLVCDSWLSDCPFNKNEQK